MSAIRVLVVLAMIGLGGCGRHAWPPYHDGISPFATLERQACLGACPVYRLAVYRDGTVEYDGRAYVVTKGRRTGRITAEQVAEIERVFAEADYFRFESRYVRMDETDQPAALTSYEVDGRRKSIDHYHGDRSAPDELTALEARLDLIVNIAQWIGTEPERPTDMPR